MIEAKVHWRGDGWCLFWASVAFDPSAYGSEYRIRRVATRYDAGQEVGLRQYIADAEFAAVIDAARIKP